jgi:hypothetical protein
LSKKWFFVLLIASIAGLIAAVSVTVSTYIISPFSISNNPLTSSLSPTPATREEGLSNNTTRPVSDHQSKSIETTSQEEVTKFQEKTSEHIIPNQVNFSKYENLIYLVSMRYPSSWQLVEGDDDNDGVNDIVRFTSPYEDRFDTYKERISVSRDNLPLKNMTLEEYSNEVINHYNESSQGFGLLDHDSDTMILAGHPAYRFINTRTLDDGMIIKQMEIGTAIGDKVYYLDYYAEEDRYADFLPVIQEMINSFQIER